MAGVNGKGFHRSQHVHNFAEMLLMPTLNCAVVRLFSSAVEMTDSAWYDNWAGTLPSHSNPSLATACDITSTHGHTA